MSCTKPYRPAFVSKAIGKIFNEFWPFASVSGQGPSDVPHTVKIGLAWQEGEEQGPRM